MSLTLVILQLWQWCPAVYHRPGYWPTSDGVMPYQVAWQFWRALRGRHAMVSNSLLRAIGLALGSTSSGSDYAELVGDMYPKDSGHGGPPDGR